MSTVNGIGTFHHGYGDPRADGSFIATNYVVVFFMPLIPLASARLRHHGLDDDLGLGPVASGRAELEVVERLPLQWPQIARTYLKCWLLVPLLLLWPMVLLIGVAGIMSATAGKDATSALMNQVAPVVAVVNAANFIGMAWYLLRRARRVGLR